MSTTTAPTRTARTQAERRASSERRLLDATARVIAKRGTSSVSFADIAKEAGCSHGLPGYLFGSKTDLLLALVDDVLARFVEHIMAPAVGDARGLEATLSSMRALLESFESPRHRTRAIYVLLGEEVGLPDELQAALKLHQHRSRQMIRQMLVEGIAAGEVRPDIDPEAQAVMLFGVVRGIGQQVMLDADAVDIPAVTEAVITSTRRAIANPEIETGTVG